MKRTVDDNDLLREQGKAKLVATNSAAKRRTKRAQAAKLDSQPGDSIAALPRLAIPDSETSEDRGPAGAGGSADSADPFGESWLEPLPVEARPVPAFPLDALPDVFRAQVEEVARVVQVAADLPVAIGLGVLAAACARRVEVAIGNTHVEPVNLYLAPVAETGERKTPPFREMLAPVHALEQEQREAAKPAIAAATEARRLAEERLKHLRSSSSKTTDSTKRAAFEAEAKQLATELPTVPPRPTLVVSDRTVEKLEVELAEQDGAALLADEEAGTLFAIACGRYSRDGASNLDVFLKAYDGGAIDTGRMSRASVECLAPALSIVVTPQPIILRQLRERPELHHRGLLPRFLWVIVPSLVGRRAYTDKAFRTGVREAYAEMVRRLFELPKATATTAPHRLKIAGAALAIWKHHADRIESEMGPGGRLEFLRAWANKQPARLARMAATLHMSEHGTSTSTISADTVSAACTIGEWFEAHALAAYDLMNADPRLEGARIVLRWLQRTKPETFTERGAFSALGRRRFATMDDLIPCLRVLVEHGHIRRVASPGRQDGVPGRNRSPLYEVNPSTLRNDPQNPQNPAEPTDTYDLADSAERLSPYTSERGEDAPGHDRGGIEHHIAGARGTAMAIPTLLEGENGYPDRVAALGNQAAAPGPSLKPAADSTDQGATGRTPDSPNASAKCRCCDEPTLGHDRAGRPTCPSGTSCSTDDERDEVTL